MVFREATPADAEQLNQLMKHVEESNMMMFDPGERKTTKGILEKLLAQQTRTSVILVVELECKLVGYLFAIGEEINRKRHAVYIAMSIHERQRGKRIGLKLLKKVEFWACEKNIRRMELTVIESNLAAISLYEKTGFEIEGIKRHSLKINGEFVNELYMSKLV
ncbi:GNAT family N-acetyltransferase [Planococcus versutus]|uniref:GNAT family N-acetyltransferase n=1 Tax=Planococcus versutus TaxID=1302659 RepID=A0A1B1RX06_9BACL|nr:GNAT family N-acetyltransferase [Planococcus versutus]ANU28537.1 GNAT family N-acetyltransferase [Planococcus versutus]